MKLLTQTNHCPTNQPTNTFLFRTRNYSFPSLTSGSCVLYSALVPLPFSCYSPLPLPPPSPCNMSNYTLESFTVETSDGVKLRTRLFKPAEGAATKDDSLVIVLVHPYSILGGSQGLLKGIASALADNGYRAVTFDMRGVGRSTGRPSLTGFAEVKDVIGVCKWVCEHLSLQRILLVGSSAGTIFFFLSFFFVSFFALPYFDCMSDTCSWVCMSQICEINHSFLFAYTNLFNY